MGLLAGDGLAMTCIVALETPDGVVMGGDRQATGHSQHRIYDSPKLTRNGSANPYVAGPFDVEWQPT